MRTAAVAGISVDDADFRDKLSQHAGGVIHFANCRLHRGGKLNPLGTVDLWVDNGVVLNPVEAFFTKRDILRVNCKGLVIAPGFIDVQINGAFGVDFTSGGSGDYEAKFDFVSEQLLQFGVTAFCPTLVSSPASVYQRILTLLERRRKFERGSKGARFLGWHLEGPFISPQQAGCHRTDNIVGEFGSSPAKSVEKMYGLRGLQNTSIVTLAPELQGSHEAIAYLLSKRIQVSLGHTNALFEEARGAIAGGARGFTHLFNATRTFHHREPGPAGLLAHRALPENSLYYGVIADGVHLHDNVIHLAYSSNPGGMMLVTDCIMAVGQGDGRFELGDQDVEVKSGVACLYGTNKVAGSLATMSGCVKRLRNILHNDRSATTDTEALEAAINCASLNPARFLKIDAHYGTLMPGSRADFLLLDSDINIRAVFMDGCLSYSPPPRD